MPDFTSTLADEEIIRQIMKVGFDCREDRSRPAQPWEADVNDWLLADPDTTRDGALYRMRRKECKVWIFTDASGLVGYGSLGSSKWPDPGVLTPELAELPKTRISLIPSVGIQTPYHGKPDGAPPEERYSTQIINHLIVEARRKMTERQNFLGLCVHPDNKRAIRLYTRMQFKPFRQTYKQGDVTYLSMILKLSY